MSIATESQVEKLVAACVDFIYEQTKLPLSEEPSPLLSLADEIVNRYGQEHPGVNLNKVGRKP